MKLSARALPVLLVLALVLLPLQAAPPPATTTFALDAVHSTALFRIIHMGAGASWGRFNELKGQVVWSDADPSQCSLEVEVQAASIDTANAKRDEHLKGPDFFNARQFPTLSFKSAAFQKQGEGYAVRGQLTLHGQTKEVVARAVKTGEKDGGPRMGHRAGWEATLTIQRSEFGMSYGVKEGVLGDEVRIIVALEGVKQ
ncbi:MAG: YceI family protein [Planctomycetota bacterium]